MRSEFETFVIYQLGAAVGESVRAMGVSEAFGWKPFVDAIMRKYDEALRVETLGYTAGASAEAAAGDEARAEAKGLRKEVEQHKRARERLRTFARKAVEDRDQARKQYEFMVQRAIEGKDGGLPLTAYREQGERLGELERRNLELETRLYGPPGDGKTRYDRIEALEARIRELEGAAEIQRDFDESAEKPIDDGTAT